MTIVVSTAGSFDIETYGGLVDWIGATLDRTDLETQIPTFIHMADLRLDRILLPPARQTTANLTTTAGTATLTLPADFKQLVTANIGGYPLDRVTTTEIYGALNGAQPTRFTIGNGELKLSPTPDAEYTVVIDYLKGIQPLSEESPSNWVLSSHADLYVYGALLQAEAYLANDERLPIWKLAFDEAIGEVNRQGLRYRGSSSPFRLRSPVCV